MIESMACGTPVIATRCGAVPEVIERRRSGIIVDDYRDMVAAIEAADALDPFELRRYRRGALLAGADGRGLRRGVRAAPWRVPWPARLSAVRGPCAARTHLGLAVPVDESFVFRHRFGRRRG